MCNTSLVDLHINVERTKLLIMSQFSLSKSKREPVTIGLIITGSLIIASLGAWFGVDYANTKTMLQETQDHLDLMTERMEKFNKLYLNFSDSEMRNIDENLNQIINDRNFQTLKRSIEIEFLEVHKFLNDILLNFENLKILSPWDNLEKTIKSDKDLKNVSIPVGSIRNKLELKPKLILKNYIVYLEYLIPFVNKHNLIRYLIISLPDSGVIIDSGNNSVINSIIVNKDENVYSQVDKIEEQEIYKNLQWNKIDNCIDEIITENKPRSCKRIHSQINSWIIAVSSKEFVILDMNKIDTLECFLIKNNDSYHINTNSSGILIKIEAEDCKINGNFKISSDNLTNLTLHHNVTFEKIINNTQLRALEDELIKMNDEDDFPFMMKHKDKFSISLTMVIIVGLIIIAGCLATRKNSSKNHHREEIELHINNLVPRF